MSNQFSFFGPRRCTVSMVCITVLVSVSALTGCAENDTTEARLGLIEDNMRRADYGAASMELANLIQAKPDHLEARLLQGKVSLAAGRAKAAETQLEHARELGAPDRQVLVPLGRSIIAQGDFDRVLQVVGPKPTDQKDAMAWYVIQADVAMFRGQLSASEGYISKVLKFNSEDLDGLIGRARLDIILGNYKEAEKTLQKATQIHPLSIAAWQALGAFYFERDRHVDAERAFINAIEGVDGIDRAEEYMLARAGLIESQWWLDKKALAKQNNKELIDSFPWHPLPKYLRGLLAFYDGEYSTSSDYLQRVIDHSPDHQPSLKMLAAINAAQGRLGRAQSFLDRYFELNPSDPEMIRLLAETFLKMGNADQALETLNPIMTTQNPEAKLLDLYGTACRYASTCKEGSTYLQKAVELSSDNVPLQIRLAAALLNNGDITGADKVMSSWIKPSSRTEKSRRLLRLERFLRSGQLQRAEEYAKKLRREQPSNLHALLALSEIAHVRGRKDDAINWLEIARDRNEAAVEPRIILATLYASKGDYENTVEVAQEAAAAHPYNANVLRLLANALLETGDLNGAVAAASEASRLAPQQAPNQIALARAQLASNDYWKARETISTLVSTDRSMLTLVRPLIIEDYKRGNQQQAHHLAAHLESIVTDSSELSEIQGDLHFLEKNLDSARQSYLKARKQHPSRLINLKIQLSKTS